MSVIISYIVISVIENCVAMFNITSFKWSSFIMGYDHGIVFNVDAYKNSVIYIGSNETNQESDVYMVNMMCD